MFKKLSPLERDFLDRILGMDPDRCFITVRSSLWDFPDTEDEAAVFAKIEATYGVDVSDIASGNLALIMRRIKKHRRGRS